MMRAITRVAPMGECLIRVLDRIDLFCPTFILNN